MGPRWRGDETRGNRTPSTGTTNDLFTGAVYLRAAFGTHTQTDNDAPMTRNTTPWSGAGRPLTSREIRGHQRHQYRQVTGLSPGCHTEPINNAN